MKRQRTTRKGDQTEKRKEKRVRRNFVDPSQMKASWLKALVCIFQHGRPVPYITGHAFCTGVSHPSIETPEHTVKWTILNKLIELKLAYMNGDSNVVLTTAGRGMSRSLNDKPILGYD